MAVVASRPVVRPADFTVAPWPVAASILRQHLMAADSTAAVDSMAAADPTAAVAGSGS
jgi:hypothetical protein